MGEFNDFLTSGEKVVFKTLSIYRTIELDKIKIKVPDAPQGVHNKSGILLLMLLYQLFCLKNIYQYSNSNYKCLIIDDTELPKTGKYIEHTGMVWSHRIRRSILGFKGLFPGLWDSKSFIILDYSLQKEKGKNSKKQYGLKKKEIKLQMMCECCNYL